MRESNCELIRIPINQINYDTSGSVDFLKSLGLGNLYLKSPETLNSIPITVILDKQRNYQLINGHEIFHGLIKAGKEWVIALCLSELSDRDDNWKYELGVLTSKLNICTLDSEDFQSLFESIKSNVTNFSKINVDKLVKSFANDDTRIFWQNLDALVEVKAGINKSKLSLLKDYIYASPDLSKLKPILSMEINRSTEKDIFNQIERLKIEPECLKLRKIDSSLTASLIVANEDRIYWSSGKHLVNAKVGISSSMWPLIECGFTFRPESKPIPNTSKFLLNQLSIKELREEAKNRNIVTKGIRKKSEFIKLLSTNQ